MNPKSIGGIQAVGGLVALLLGFLEMTFLALLFLAIALIVTGIDKFTAPGEAAPPVAAAPRAYPGAGAPPAY